MPDRRLYRTSLAPLLFLAIAMVQPSRSRAQDQYAPEALESIRGAAMGTGARASAVGTSALAYNPAGLATGRLYHLEAFGGYVPQWGQWEAGASVVDSMTQKLAAGLSLRGLFGDGEQAYSGIDGRLGLGVPVSEAFSLGLSGRYLSLDRDGQAPEGEDGELAKGLTLDASMLIQPVAALRIIAVGYNLIPMGSALAPTTVGGGVALGDGQLFTVGADLLVDLTTYEGAEWTLGGGGELLAGGQVPLRAGYAYDHGRRVHVVSGGIGYVDQKVGLDLSLSQDVSGASQTRLLFGFKYFVQ